MKSATTVPTEGHRTNFHSRAQELIATQVLETHAHTCDHVGTRVGAHGLGPCAHMRKHVTWEPGPRPTDWGHVHTCAYMCPGNQGQGQGIVSVQFNWLSSNSVRTLLLRNPNRHSLNPSAAIVDLVIVNASRHPPRPNQSPATRGMSELSE